MQTYERVTIERYQFISKISNYKAQSTSLAVVARKKMLIIAHVIKTFHLVQNVLVVNDFGISAHNRPNFVK